MSSRPHACAQGGKDAASPRYIFTRLAPLARHVFNEADDQLLKYLNEEGQNIEPEWCARAAASATVASSHALPSPSPHLSPSTPRCSRRAAARHNACPTRAWRRYMPILPMVLVNGAEGIGTGWSTYIPNYNPRDIVDNIKRLLDGQEQVRCSCLWGKGGDGLEEEVAGVSAAKHAGNGWCGGS